MGNAQQRASRPAPPENVKPKRTLKPIGRRPSFSDGQSGDGAQKSAGFMGRVRGGKFAPFTSDLCEKRRWDRDPYTVMWCEGRLPEYSLKNDSVVIAVLYP